MFKSFICLPLVAALGLSGTSAAFAQNFDTSVIKTDDALAARLPEKIKAAGVLTIGSDTAYAPWEFLSEKDGQTPEGIDVDIAKAIGKKLGVGIDFQTSAFDAILPALAAFVKLALFKLILAPTPFAALPAWLEHLSHLDLVRFHGVSLGLFEDVLFAVQSGQADVAAVTSALKGQAAMTLDAWMALKAPAKAGCPPSMECSRDRRTPASRAKKR